MSSVDKMKHRAIGGLFAALFLAGNAWRQGGVITTFAGGPFLFTGNGQPAVNAPLGSIYGITLDPFGAVVIADGGNCLVERINPDGSLSVIAGNGITQDMHTGDGGPALNAALALPTGVAYDAQGNLYIAEFDRISRVSPQGIITTYAGGGSDAASNGISALKASISPTSGGIVVDASGTVYFSDYPTNRVRKVTPDGTITTVAGTGTAGFSGDGGLATAANLALPYGLALDGTGNLYIADTGNRRIRQVTPAGIISTFANAYATGVAFDNNGVLYLVGAGRVSTLTPGPSNLALIGGIPGSMASRGMGVRLWGRSFL